MRVRSVVVLITAAFLTVTPLFAQLSRYGSERGGEDETGP